MILIMIEVQYSSTAYYIETIAPHVPLTYLLSEKKTLCCQQYSTCYAAVRIYNCLKRTCNQRSHYENYRRFPLQMEAITCLPQNRHFSWWAKMNGTQRRTLVSPCIACTEVWQKAPLGLKWRQTVKNQARSLSHCWVMGVWRHQSGN